MVQYMFYYWQYKYTYLILITCKPYINKYVNLHTRLPHLHHFLWAAKRHLQNFKHPPIHKLSIPFNLFLWNLSLLRNKKATTVKWGNVVEHIKAWHLLEHCNLWAPEHWGYTKKIREDKQFQTKEKMARQMNTKTEVVKDRVGNDKD